jgi:hypothetical protein
MSTTRRANSSRRHSRASRTRAERGAGAFSPRCARGAARRRCLRPVAKEASCRLRLPVSIKISSTLQRRHHLRLEICATPPTRPDAVAVARLRAGGAVVIGRSNMIEFAFSGVGINPHYGTPANPYDRGRRRIPGGSSSGAAVSVVDGMAAFALGTDTGGSVRIPAALCGIAGFKPTRARVPLAGAFPFDDSGSSGRSHPRSPAARSSSRIPWRRAATQPRRSPGCAWACRRTICSNFDIEVMERSTRRSAPVAPRQRSVELTTPEFRAGRQGTPAGVSARGTRRAPQVDRA